MYHINSWGAQRMCQVCAANGNSREQQHVSHMQDRSSDLGRMAQGDMPATGLQ